jgi:hypothetical protein
MDNDKKYEYYKSILVIYNTITSDESIFPEKIMSNLKAVKRKLNIIGYGYEYDLLLDKTCPLFLKFQKEIEADEVEYLLDYNYDILIEDDAEDENKRLIMSLIRATKEAWFKLNNRSQKIIKERIKLCLNLSLIYKLCL